MRNTIGSLAGSIVLITGAAMGMGKMYAHLAVRDNAAHVVLWDINGQLLEEAADELRGRGSLINNAGIVRGKYFWDHDQRSDIAATMAINTLALMHITREFLPAMIEGGRTSRIVNVASAAGLLANPRMSIYSSSKWAVVGWSDSLRLELVQAGHHHIKVTTFCPSYINTGMFEGARGPLLTPLLEPAAVTERVWAAMKAGTPMLMMPWTVKLSTALRGILPIAVWDVVAGRMFGVYKSMDNFTGRK